MTVSRQWCEVTVIYSSSCGGRGGYGSGDGGYSSGGGDGGGSYGSCDDGNGRGATGGGVWNKARIPNALLFHHDNIPRPQRRLNF